MHSSMKCVVQHPSTYIVTVKMEELTSIFAYIETRAVMFTTSCQSVPMFTLKCTRYNSIKFVSDLRQVGGFLHQ